MKIDMAFVLREKVSVIFLKTLTRNINSKYTITHMQIINSEINDILLEKDKSYFLYTCQEI